MAILIHEAFKLGLINRDILEHIPLACDYCDKDIYVSESIYQIFCDNRICAGRLISRLKEMLTLLGTCNYEEDFLLKIVKDFNMRSSYQIFMLKAEVCEKYGDKKLIELNELINKEINKRRQLWEVVRLGCIPYVSSVALEIFKDYTDITEVFEEIERSQVMYVINKIGIDYENGILVAVFIYNKLLEYKSELILGSKLLVK